MAQRYELHREGSRGFSSSHIDYAQELNPQQLDAVSTTQRFALVIAGAGSGKTRTLTYRVAWLTEHGVHPYQILLLTFTNKAAKEMLERVKEIASADLGALWGGTFHSVANRILRRHAVFLGYTPTFTILDSDDRKTLLRKIIKDVNSEDKSNRFPKAEVISAILSLADNTRRSISKVIECDYAYLYQFTDAIEEINKRYAAKKKESNSMDFDDLLTKLIELLQQHPEVRQLYQNRFRHILVDEYQDTNAVQDEMIDLMTGEETSLMVVGDDAQSIYSWRGADMNHILSFSRKYMDAHVFKIETNYRSVPEILNLSNAAIAANECQIEKQLRSVRPAASMQPVVVALNDSRVEAMFVAQRIQELIDAGISPSEIAILYRAHFHSMDVQMEMVHRKIPFRITSGIRFFEQAHVKDVVAFLRFVTNPQDEVSFNRIAGLLPGIGPGTLAKLWAQWTKSLADGKENKSYVEVLSTFRVPAKAQEGWTQLAWTLDELRPDDIELAPAAMIESVIEAMYDDYMQLEFDNYDQRHQDLVQLSAFAQQFDHVDEFLAQMSLLGNTDDDGQGVSEQRQEVTLSTIHQAKGLEWQVVFLIGLCEGMFPHQRALDEGDMQALEEERRLFYVGITRAKDQLYLTYPRWNVRAYSGYQQMPSRFFDEVPAELLDEWVVD
jgi:DNA helicase-2/ATP-dependent DNA helicase PcrA